jgi:hypothetical protein
LPDLLRHIDRARFEAADADYQPGRAVDGCG